MRCCLLILSIMYVCVWVSGLFHHVFMFIGVGCRYLGMFLSYFVLSIFNRCTIIIIVIILCTFMTPEIRRRNKGGVEKRN